MMSKILVDRALIEQAKKALGIAQNNLASSRESAFRFGDGELWDEYEVALLGINLSLAQPAVQHLPADDTEGGAL